MAEADRMLVAIDFDADGAIKKATVLDSKFEKLSKTFRNSKKPVEDAANAQKKLDKSIQGTTKSTTDNNVATIAKLQVMEAATSGLNQLISAQYKRIDADLASGKITAEEAEERRKAIKQQEKYTGILESAIAISRLYTVAQVIGAAVMTKATAATNTNTKAVVANNAALAMNPYVRFAIIAMTVVAALMAMELKFNGVSKAIEGVRKQIEKVTDAFATFRDMGDTNWGFGTSSSKQGTAEPSFRTESRKQGFGG